MSRRPLDAYDTHASAVAELRARVHICGRIIEPCSGRGAIAKSFAGQQVFTNDLDETTPASAHVDACAYTACLPFDLRDQWVVTNPPFSDALRILQHYRNLAARCAFLLRLSFLEPTKARAPWLAENPPSGLIVLPRYSFTGDGKTDSVTCAWMIWGHPLEPAIAIAGAA